MFQILRLSQTAEGLCQKELALIMAVCVGTVHVYQIANGLLLL